MVEEFVELFIGVIYTQLLKRIYCKILKAKYVQHSQEPVKKEKILK